MRAFVALALVSLCSSCTATHGLRYTQLEKLDGFDASVERSRELETVSGEKVAFTGSNLTLVTDREKLEPKFLRLSVKEGVLLGTLAVGPQLRLSYADIKRIEVTTFSATASGSAIGRAIAIAAVVGFVVVTGLGVAAIARALSGLSWGGLGSP